MIRKILYIWFKIGAWCFFTLGSLMAIIFFIGIFVPSFTDEPDPVLRVISFAITGLMGFLGYLMVKAKELHP
ncbi:hypothetical protein R50073_21300 [Maricurvus nonylphenolicus]